MRPLNKPDFQTADLLHKLLIISKMQLGMSGNIFDGNQGFLQGISNKSPLLKG